MPIQWVVGYEKTIPIVDIPGVVICLLGLISLILLGRRLRISAFLTVPLTVIPFFIFLCTQENLVPAVRRMLPVDLRTNWIPSMITLSFFAALLTAVLVFLRDRVPAFRSDRRAFLRTSTAAICAAPALALTSGFITRKDFHIREVAIAIPNIPKDLAGLRIVQLSDLHTGVFFTPRDVARVVDAANGLRAHLTFVTGDLITTSKDPLDACLMELRRLKADSGVRGCMGNHEHFAECEDYVELQAARLGMPFLRLKSELLKFGDHSLNLVGVDYQRRNSPYLVDVEQLVSLDSLNVLLSHNPDVFPVAAQKGFDLTIAGHTHGGQINFEIFGRDLNVADFFTPYTKGLYTLPTSSLYVNSGLGTIGMPVRLGAPPEITLIRLCNY